MILRRLPIALVAILAAGPAFATDLANPNPVQRNILIFVADGMRHDAVNADDAPTMLALRQKGVHFSNSHSLFPTVTMVNASVIATGHAPGDTGVLTNNPYTGNGASPFIGLESDNNLRTMNGMFDNKNFINETSLLAAARAAGFHTAAIGKYGPALQQDVSQYAAGVAPATVFIDDATNASDGVPMPGATKDRLSAIGLTDTPPGVDVPNNHQQAWFLRAATEVVLPSFIEDKTNDKPFVMVYWSRDPDKSQHDQTDNRNKETKKFDQLGVGINGPSVKKGIKDADDNLAALLKYLNETDDPHNKGHKLIDNTDVFVTSDHGFSTISRHELGGGKFVDDFCSTIQFYDADDDGPHRDTPDGFLPLGFLGIDLGEALKLPMFDAGKAARREADGAGTLEFIPVDPHQKPVIDEREQHPESYCIVGGNGKAAYTLVNGKRVGKLDASTKILVAPPVIYFPNATITDGKASPADVALCKQVVEFLARQSTIAAIFVDTDTYGPMPGTLAFTDVNLKGSGQMVRPAIAISFTSFSMDPKNPCLTGVSISDTGLGEGQGNHGSFSRQDTFNNMIAFGPDFKAGLDCTDPVSNADVAPTLAYLLGLKIGGNGTLAGRVIEEALKNGPAPHGAATAVVQSAPTPDGFHTDLQMQTFKDSTGAQYRYFDWAGMPGRVVTGKPQ